MEHGSKRLALLSLSALIALALLSTPDVSAAPTSKERVLETVRALERTLAEGSHSAAELERVQRRLEAVLSSLEGQGRGPRKGQHRNECVQFAHAIYKRVTSETQALERAHRQCKGRIDMAVVQTTFAVFKRVQTRSQALDTTMALQRKHRLVGKLPLVEYAFATLRRVKTRPDAMKESLQLAGSVPRDSLACVERAFATYKRTQTRPDAVRQSFELCQ